MVNGSIEFWKNQKDCKIFPAADGFWKTVVDIGQCDAWVAWVWANALLHLMWVLMLLLCQIYQVSCSFERNAFIERFGKVKFLEKCL